MTQTKVERTAEELQSWLVTHVAAVINTPPEQLDIKQPFTAYGISSVDAVNLSGELEDWLNSELSPTLLYAYPTIEALVGYLADKRTKHSGVSSGYGKTFLHDEPIAIVGMGCRFPGANDIDSFWRLLEAGGDAITTIPAERWDANEFYHPDPATPGKMHTLWGGFISDVDKFDPYFFGISPREADRIDPQHRILLEVAWASFEHAGIDPFSLRGTQTGVFIGICTCDYHRLQPPDKRFLNAYSGTGTAPSIAANRLSYFFDFRGPSLALDTACSSSLVTMHLAVQSLRGGESNLAVVGGVNLILTPDLNITFSQARMMSPTGRCRSFDADADGYVRSEGCGVMILKRFSDALKDGDRILALVRGTAVNQDGHSNGLTAPNGPSQEAVIEQALANAQVRPAQLGYVETHGSGTSLGDPIEFHSLKSVLMRDRRADQHCVISSVKTNIGHLESASGIAGAIKAVLSLQHDAVPGLRHLKKLNPHISVEDTPFQLSPELLPWKRGRERRLAGINSFGFGGTNAHVVLEEAPAAPTESERNERSTHILTLSAMTPNGLKAVAKSYASFLEDSPDATLADICFTSNSGRAHLDHRLAVVANGKTQLQQQLSEFAEGKELPNLICGTASSQREPKVVFLFSGQGSQYVGMGRGFYETQPVFHEALDECARVLDQYLEQPLLTVLYPPDNQSPLLDQTAFTQPALFAVEYALAKMWNSWGIKPAAVMGHSVGEYVAACLAGVISLEDSLRLIVERARLMQTLPPIGEMAGVYGEEAQVLAILEPYRDTVDVAAYNAPQQFTISGHRDSMKEVRTRLQASKIRVQTLNVSHAFHSPLMEPILDEFERITTGVQFNDPQIPWFSNLSGARVQAGDTVDARYWRRHIREAVQFSKGMSELHQQNYQIFLEIGPGTGLIVLGKRCITDEAVQWFPTLRKGTDEWQPALRTLGALYTRGAKVNWPAVYGGQSRRRISLPSYPFERKRCWVDTGEFQAVEVTQYSRPAQSADGAHPLLGHKLCSALKETQYENHLSLDRVPYLNDHKVLGSAVFPAAGYLETALAAAASLGLDNYSVTGLEFHEALAIAENRTVVTQVIVSPEDSGKRSFQFLSLHQNGNKQDETWKLHSSSTLVTREESQPSKEVFGIEEATSECVEELPIDLFYDECTASGLNYGEAFRGIERLWWSKGKALARIRNHESSNGTNSLLSCTLLDSCFQVLGAALFAGASSTRNSLYLPVGVDQFSSYQQAVPAWATAAVRDNDDAELLVGDVWVFDLEGKIICEVSGLRLKRITSEIASSESEISSDQWLFELGWEQLALPVLSESASHSAAWLLLMDTTGVGDRLADALEQRGHICFRAEIGSARKTTDERRFEVDPRSGEDIGWLLEQLSLAGLRGVIDLWPLQTPLDAEPSFSLIKEAQESGCHSLLHLVQALTTTRNETPRLMVVTRGAQAVNGEQSSLFLAHSTLTGMARVVAVEHPELKCAVVDLDPVADPNEAGELVAELFAASKETQVAFRAGKRWVPTLMKAQAPEKTELLLPDTPYQLTVGVSGLLNSLTLEPKPRRAPGYGEVEIEVRSAGLNFRDVLSALGLYPGDAGPLGSECAGTIVAVGPGVDDLKVGDDVIAIAAGSFSSHVTAYANFVVPKPEPLTYEEAATIPINFLTAHYGLHHLANMTSEDRVLIHAAAGGVGLAAVQLVQRRGAEVFATAGSPVKRDFLAAMGVKNLMDSRSLSFADEVIERTKGEGVTVLLNSLGGDFIPKSLSIMRPAGRFVEIGKNGVWPVDRVREYRGDIDYTIFDLAEICREEPLLVRAMLLELVKDFEAGLLKPTAHEVFSMQDAIGAFRHMAQAKHIGKVVISRSSQTASQFTESAVKPDASYLVTGGLGSLGRLTASWLADQGAKHLLLIGRSAPEGAAAETVNDLRERGVNTVIAQADCSDRAQMEDVLSRVSSDMPPLHGVVHAAGVLDDDPIASQDWKRFRKVLEPKVDGAWNLHLLTKDQPLDFFVTFSSVSSLLGSPGQANYAAANAFLDALAHYRHRQDRPSLSINWGPWANSGMAAKTGSSRYWRALAMRPIEPDEGLRLLGKLLQQNASQVAVFPVNWSHLFRLVPAFREQFFFSKILSDNEKSSSGTPALRLQLEATPETERRDILIAFMRGQIAKVLEFEAADAVDITRPLNELGLDSLMAIEMRTVLEMALGITLPVTLVYEYPTIEAMVDFLLTELFGSTATDAATEPPPKETHSLDDLIADIDQLSDNEAQQLLSQKL